jgi:hypothetical protein
MALEIKTDKCLGKLKSRLKAKENLCKKEEQPQSAINNSADLEQVKKKRNRTRRAKESETQVYKLLPVSGRKVEAHANTTAICNRQSNRHLNNMQMNLSEQTKRRSVRDYEVIINCACC